MTALLDGPRHEVVTRVLDEEENHRRHIVVSLSGAHAFGYPSPDSGVDLKAIHIEPTANLVGLQPPRQHHTRMEFLDEIEIDYTSNEIAQALTGVLQGNGAFLERVLGALVLRSSDEYQGLRPLVKGALSKRVHRYYQGFAAVQLRELEESRFGTVKAVLNTLRTALTGAHLLRTSEMVVDVTRLLEQYHFEGALPLVEAKRAGERVVWDEDERAHWTEEARRAFQTLDEALERSGLPDEPSNRTQIEEWLIDVRHRHF